MAGPVAHILLALKILNLGLIETDHEAFIIGTSFPDIRYLGVINRKTTHPHPISWNDVLQEQSAFLAGIKFHALVDIIREEFLNKHKIYDELPDSSVLSQCMKLVEDHILYSKHQDWSAIIQIFDSLLPGEYFFGIKEKDLRLWHNFIQRYCSKPPMYIAPKLLLDFLKPFSVKANDISSITKMLEQNNYFQNMVLRFYDQFENLLE